MASELNWHVRHDDEIWTDADGVGKWIANCGSAEIAKQIVDAMNTRPAPAATDTGLVTVGFQCSSNAVEWCETLIPKVREQHGYKIREVVTRSQAVELLAAKDCEIARLKAALGADAAQFMQSLVDECSREIEKRKALEAQLSAFNDLCKLTFVIQHNPNCPHKFLIRLPGKSCIIDMKPYGDQLGKIPHQTADVIGSGETLNEAFVAALAVNEAQS